MPTELTRRYFIFLGAVVGLLVGTAVALMQSNPLQAFTGYFFNLKFMLFYLAIYVLLQFAIGIPLKKPIVSRSIYAGIAFGPISYAFFMSYAGVDASLYIFYFLLVVGALEFPVAYTMLAGIMISISGRFFTGLDFRKLSEKRLSSSSYFAFDLESPDAKQTDLNIGGDLCESIGFYRFNLGLCMITKELQFFRKAKFS